MIRYLRTIQKRLPILMVLGAITASAASVASPALAPLRAYEGTWRVVRHSNGTVKTERLVNHCVELGIYFACEQVVDNQPTALLVIIPADSPGHYYTQSIMPEGRATGLDQLQIEGNRWTFTSRRQQGGKVTYFRNVNVFQDKDHVHFESAESTDEKNWTVEISGDETRLSH